MSEEVEKVSEAEKKTVDINIVIPGREEPKYLRRMIALAEVKEAIHNDKRDMGDISVETLKMLIGYIASFVQGVDDPVDVIMDLSQDEYEYILSEIGSVTVPKGSDTGSESSSPAE